MTARNPRKGASGLRGHLNPNDPPEPPKRAWTGRSSQNKGKDGEREVKRLWIAAGWPQCFRTPMSGGMRSSPDDPTPPFPLDLASGWPEGYTGEQRPRFGPWMVEVKFSKLVAQPSRGGGWMGQAFIRRTLGEITGTAANVNRMSSGYRVEPVLFARANRMPWRVFVHSSLAIPALLQTTEPTLVMNGYIELDPATFFSDVSRSILT